MTETLADWIAPKRTALLIIDIQEDFASPEGKLGKIGLDFSAVPAAIDASNRLATAARKAGVPVYFVGLSTSPETDSATWKLRMTRQGQGSDEGMAVCRAGESGSAFYGVLPEDGDQIVYKTKYSGFYGTDLHTRLRQADVDTLVVCGLTTECCVDCTVRDAFHLDYNVFLATDACAAYGAEIHEAAVLNLNLNCDIPVLTKDVESAWGQVHG